ncbi:glycoside hydrolase [Brenneria sp. HEZEL_4_2_4]|uniref:GH12 family glycosyl hydrolase domain-containing protein n=2 Tax=unclassified Brenneria TaxID=2634434 RepID=UPI0015526E8F|nr:glycoside hydrolase [Brenneria sp. hezel4-2-4]MEE3650147.1 glycoside hydrolase [Brenneria sp. HEZEL_4_2_4]NPD00106.1 glycoside hydrolase [Brenneria sp. hezel4-2-4]
MFMLIKSSFLLLRPLLSILIFSILLAPLHASAVTSSKDADKLYFSQNKYYLFNNAWGKDSVKGWKQSITYNSATNMGWTWNWPSTTSSVKGYPSIVSGWHWTAGYTAGSGFPTKLASNKNINTKVTYSIKAKGTYNAAYDIWFHNTDKATWSSTPTDELMIWLNNTQAGPLGTYVETVNIGGTRWKVSKGWLDAGNGKGWNVFSFVRTANTSKASLNIKNFTDYLVNNKKWMNNAKYVSSVEFGTEIYQGAGSMTISNWSVNVK